MCRRRILFVRDAAVQQTTYSPVFDYVKVHHVSVVTPEFLKFLKGSVEMTVHVTQHISAPPDKIGTENAIVVDSIKTGEAKGCGAIFSF